MKILHTADWHLGKRLDSFSRMDEQHLVMEEIIRIADQQEVDLVLIAGDLFDSFNPGVEAIELFYKTIKRLAKNGVRPVIAIAGNHDSPNLIDAPDPLARASGIILIGHPNALVTPFTTEGFTVTHTDKGFIELRIDRHDYPIRILHTAYANEIRLKQYLGEEKEVQLNRALAKNWQELAEAYCDDRGVNILMAHLYMNKIGTPLIEEPDGEKPIKIGNADLIYSESIPDQIQYTALGHIHGFKNIGSAQKPVVYASSPLCYSFAEAGQTKYVNIVNAVPGEDVTYKQIALRQGKPLVRKSFADIGQCIAWLSENPETFVELTLKSQTFLKAEDRKLIYQTHSGIVYLIPVVQQDQQNLLDKKEINLTQDIATLFTDYFKSKNANQAPNEDILNLFREILNS
ncbi:exonuclease SbcCD subunit D [Sphingobacterium puteale]|uniref:Nuclease SbcCD subunit D n=1 Tax=Sphingobacterium puteale TaxID=2420510 RepID=A0A420VX80_9SPHI|nr:exonuclease SbcCD subunit D [Sphingobacterium puteale]RKO71003.1 exonuclease SbcCD subunit D [Sphingobacterium puteale]